MEMEIERRERPLDVEELRKKAMWDSKGELHKATVEWLKNLCVWDCFFTLTFRVSVRSVGTAETMFKKWMRKNWRGVACFYAVELHPGGHGAHLHGLMNLTARRIQRTALWESWFKLHGRCSFEFPQNVDSVTGYCSRASVLEVLKDGRWGILGLSQNERKVNEIYSRGVGKFALESPLVDLVDLVDLWDGAVPSLSLKSNPSNSAGAC